MPIPTKGARLGGSPAHERLMLANLATALFEHGRITTTQTKARRLRPFAERLITKARKADLHNRREVMKVIRDKDVVHKLFAEIGPQFEGRPGGYIRIVKTMPRKGDNAPMAVIELVAERTVTAEAGQARSSRFARNEPKGTPAPAVADEAAAAAGRAGAPQDDAVADGTPSAATDIDAAAPAEGEDTVSAALTQHAAEDAEAASPVAASPAATVPDSADEPGEQKESS